METQNREVTQMANYKDPGIPLEPEGYPTQYVQRCTKTDPIRFRGPIHIVDPGSSGNLTLCGLDINGGDWYIFHERDAIRQLQKISVHHACNRIRRTRALAKAPKG